MNSKNFLKVREMMELREAEQRIRAGKKIYCGQKGKRQKGLTIIFFSEIGFQSILQKSITSADTWRF